MRGSSEDTPARELATRVLTEVFKSRKNLDMVLSKHLIPIKEPRTRGLVRVICYGVMRWYYQLEAIIKSLVPKPLKEKDTDLKALLLSGIYQIKYLRTPDYATINESVDVAKTIGKPWAARLVNAVLRKYQRGKEDIDNSILISEISKYSFPGWFLKKIDIQWPEHKQMILTASNQHPPLHLRLNTRRHSRQDYINLLKKHDIDASFSKISEQGILLSKAMNVEDIPGFMEGEISVQDFGAQLAAPLMDCQPGQRILDACAAPGGKSGHILELNPRISELISIDIEKDRINLIDENMKRLKQKATLLQADITKINSWWDGVPFDRILLDAPCSASGIIRRRPDIKYLRSPTQITSLVETQKLLLGAVWQVLKSGGKLLYCTCSIFKEESDEQITQFLNQHNNVRVLPIDVFWGVKTSYGRQTLPGFDESDGFFYSLLEKI